MKKEIVALRWNDASAYDEESLDKHHFDVSPTIQIGIVFDEDDKKIRLVHSYDITDEQHDFIVIPTSLIEQRITLGFFDTKTNQINDKQK